MNVFLKEEERKKREELEFILAENNRKIEEAQKKLVSYRKYEWNLNETHNWIFFQKAEERLLIIEEQRKMDEQRHKMRKEQEKRVKEEQKIILGKGNSRHKISFSIKPGVS